jgi:uncharacterized protein
VRPGDHPEFFRFPAPEGRSRESSIVLDRDGRFFHEGELVEHPGLLAALHRWIDRHPVDQRYILTNGYDWTYFTVEDVPYAAVGITSSAELMLSDGSIEPFPETGYRVGPADALYCSVKGGRFEARFTPAAQTALAPFLAEEEGRLVLRVGERRIRLPAGETR